MNILVIVFSFLMLFSILTVSRVQSYLDFTQVRRQYRAYMVDHERALVRSRAEDLYASFKVSSREGGTKLNGRLDLSLLLNPTEQESDRKFMTEDVLSRLISALSRDEAMGPMIVEALLAYTRQVDYETINKTRMLKEVMLAEEGSEIQKAWCKVLFGMGGGGHPMLTEFVSVSSRSTGAKGISVYLARRELLEALFYDNQDLVRDILSRRQEMYRDYKNEADDKLAKQEELKTLVGTHRYATYMDFRVSGTKPPE